MYILGCSRHIQIFPNVNSSFHCKAASLREVIASALGNPAVKVRTAALPPSVFVTPAEKARRIFFWYVQLLLEMKLRADSHTFKIFSSQPYTNQPLQNPYRTFLTGSQSLTPVKLTPHLLESTKQDWQCPCLSLNSNTCWLEASWNPSTQLTLQWHFSQWALPNHCSHWICEKHGSQNLRKKPWQNFAEPMTKRKNKRRVVDQHIRPIGLQNMKLDN